MFFDCWHQRCVQTTSVKDTKTIDSNTPTGNDHGAYTGFWTFYVSPSSFSLNKFHTLEYERFAGKFINKQQNQPLFTSKFHPNCLFILKLLSWQFFFSDKMHRVLLIFLFFLWKILKYHEPCVLSEIHHSIIPWHKLLFKLKNAIQFNVNFKIIFLLRMYALFVALRMFNDRCWDNYKPLEHLN